MSDLRKVIAAYGQLAQTFNQLNCDQRDLFVAGVRKFLDLTNDAVFWTQMQALLVGTSAVVGGAAGIAGSMIPKGADAADFGGFSPELLRQGAKLVSKTTPQVGEAGRLLAQGPLTKKEAGRSLAERVEIPGTEQVKAGLERQLAQMADAIARMQQAKQRTG